MPVSTGLASTGSIGLAASAAGAAEPCSRLRPVLAGGLAVAGDGATAQARDRAPRRVVSIAPGVQMLRSAMRLATPDLFTKAVERWVVAPSSMVEVRPAKILPGQLDRIRGTEFASPAEVIRDFSGGFDSLQRETVAYRLNDVVLLNGVLHAGDAARHLRARSHRLPLGLVPRETIRASMYEGWLGNRWFGNWLCEDCLAYRLAEEVGAPLTTSSVFGHMADYEQALGMEPTRTQAARFSELVLFDDSAHNEHKRARADDLRRRLSPARVDRHPGVFLLRGASGDRRVLSNERELAERLAVKRGFRIVDPMALTAAEIVAACAGADVVAGVEGSHLVHGLMVMPNDARLFVVQPPDRTVAALKLVTDRQGQDYSFVVGVGTNETFHVDAGEVERTLDIR